MKLFKSVCVDDINYTSSLFSQYVIIIVMYYMYYFFLIIEITAAICRKVLKLQSFSLHNVGLCIW